MCTYIKIHQIIYFKYVQFLECQLYLNKDEYIQGVPNYLLPITKLYVIVFSIFVNSVFSPGFLSSCVFFFFQQSTGSLFCSDIFITAMESHSSNRHCHSLHSPVAAQLQRKIHKLSLILRVADVFTMTMIYIYVIYK